MRAATMVGADRYDEANGLPAAPRPAAGEAASVVDFERPPDPDSYWANIDYPPVRPQFVRPPVDSQPRRVRRRRRILAAVVVVAALAIAGGSYAVGRTNGHAPVPGLQRRIATLEHTVASQRAQLRAQAATLETDRDQVRVLRDRAAATQATVAVCRRALEDADRAFGTESAALHALSVTDLGTADALAAQFGTELDQYADAAHDCRAASTSA